MLSLSLPTKFHLLHDGYPGHEGAERVDVVMPSGREAWGKGTGFGNVFFFFRKRGKTYWISHTLPRFLSFSLDPRAEFCVSFVPAMVFMVVGFTTVFFPHRDYS